VRHGAKAADLRGAVATGECGGFFFKVSYLFLHIETHYAWDPLIWETPIIMAFNMGSKR
jgi:hypothetical protein